MVAAQESAIIVTNFFWKPLYALGTNRGCYARIALLMTFGDTILFC